MGVFDVEDYGDFVVSERGKEGEGWGGGGGGGIEG